MSTTTPSPPLVCATAAALGAELEDWGPRSGADAGHPRTSGRVLFRSDEPALEIGVWACTPGGWQIVDRPDSETVHVLEGRARLTDAAGGSVEIGPGDVLVLPRGWSGRWDVLETVRKLYVLSR